MTRKEALELQHLQSLKKHDGAVIWKGKPYYLGALNYPHNELQMAKISDATGKAPQGSIKGGWVPLAEVDAVPF